MNAKLGNANKDTGPFCHGTKWTSVKKKDKTTMNLMVLFCCLSVSVNLVLSFRTLIFENRNVQKRTSVPHTARSPQPSAAALSRQLIQKTVTRVEMTLATF